MNGRNVCKRWAEITCKKANIIVVFLPIFSPEQLLCRYMMKKKWQDMPRLKIGIVFILKLLRKLFNIILVYDTDV